MFNFDFYNPTKLMFGQGRIADIAGEIPRGQSIDNLRRRQHKKQWGL